MIIGHSLGRIRQLFADGAHINIMELLVMLCRTCIFPPATPEIHSLSFAEQIPILWAESRRVNKDVASTAVQRQARQLKNAGFSVSCLRFPVIKQRRAACP